MELYRVRYNKVKGVKYSPDAFKVSFTLLVRTGNANEQTVQGLDITNDHVRCFNSPWYTWEKIGEMEA